jgi:DNA invertase Pin-like site-specific DNA recombinase
MIFNYIRVSTADQNTARQLADVPCDRIYKEHISGKDTNRPELQAMLMNMRADDWINVHELSRLARNTKDLLAIVEQVLDAGANIRFHKENLCFEAGKRADPFQQLMLTMLGAISTFERDLMLERQREGIAIAKAAGKYKGRQSRFTAEQQAEIKERFKDPRTNKAALAREFGMTRAYLYQLAAA